jgi:MFS family permease/quinol monooxygenase YgiN
MTDPQPESPPSAWAPLRQPLFRALWIATLVSNIGTWVHEVGAGWLMVTLDPHPLMVSLVQAATALPIFLLALPGGALADIVDRRRYLIYTQVWMLVVVLALALTTALGWINAWGLLVFTFALACGAALNTPAWAATLPEIVPRAQLQSAIALNSLGINLARAVGPALAGVMVAAAGPQAAFLLNALSFIGVIVVLARWPRTPQPSTLPAERFSGALRAGLRYVREATALQYVMGRAAAFFIFASATWALLPLVARAAGGGADTYGLLLAGIGAGAVGAALVMPSLRRRCSRDVLVRGATVVYAAATVGVALAGSLALLLPAVLAGGAAWLGLLSTLHVSAQTAVPQWVRARALSLYLMVYAAGMTGGAVLWGALAARWGVPAALLLAAAGGVLAMFATWRLTLGGEDGLAHSAPAALMRSTDHADIAPERGPVAVHVEYRIAPEDAAAFVAAAQGMERIRRRDGALSWGLFEDPEMPGRYVETFVVESWAEHMRQHHRGTAGDAPLFGQVRGFHRGDGPPRVTHWIAVNTIDETGGAAI